MSYLEQLAGVLQRVYFVDSHSHEEKWECLRRICRAHFAYFSNTEARWNGVECWPFEADTMIGVARLLSLKRMVEHVVREHVPGDLAETGVWKGGACILMNAALRELGEQKARRVHIFDSFAGLPEPYLPQDRGDKHSELKFLAVSVDEVKRNFDKYGLLSDNLVFREGLFKDTMPRTDDIKQLAILRLDGDMYCSTIEVLEALYDKVSPGGFVVIDDWRLPGANKAVQDFRKQKGITAPLVPIDASSVYWQVPRTAA